MKPLPPPHVPGSAEAEKFDNALRTIFSVPKEAVVKEEAKRRRARARKRQKKSSS